MKKLIAALRKLSFRRKMNLIMYMGSEDMKTHRYVPIAWHEAFEVFDQKEGRVLDREEVSRLPDFSLLWERVTEPRPHPTLQ